MVEPPLKLAMTLAVWAGSAGLKAISASLAAETV